MAGTTTTPVGALRVIGLCVPWERAHVSTGRKDRQPWQDHIAYLHVLLACPDVTNPKLPTLILGDFNQTIPSRRAPLEAQELLQELLNIYAPATRANPERRMVYHILTSPELHTDSVEELPAMDDARRLSDHYGERIFLQLQGRTGGEN